MTSPRANLFQQPLQLRAIVLAVVLFFFLIDSLASRQLERLKLSVERLTTASRREHSRKSSRQGLLLRFLYDPQKPKFIKQLVQNSSRPVG